MNYGNDREKVNKVKEMKDLVKVTEAIWFGTKGKGIIGIHKRNGI